VDARAEVLRDAPGWTFVGYDINGDGHFDVFEYIRAADVEESERRGGIDIGRRMVHHTGDDGAERMARESRPIEGKLTEIKTIQLRYMDEPHMVGKVVTQDGIIRADLGPQKQLEPLKMSEGDTITVVGREARIKDRRLLFATRIKLGDQQVTVDRGRLDGQRRIRGTVVGIDRMTVTQTGRDHTIARIRTDRDFIVPVELGSAQAAQRLSIREGDRITVLGNRGKIDNRVALFANQVRLNDGETMTLLRAQGRESPFRQTRYTTEQGSRERPED
jgi:hypothetical protein